eukprot:3064248-Alexandrium_andersonii.AAC.1
MVYQGTTWGPALWNTFVADADVAIASAEFDHVKFADDLTPFKVLDREVTDAEAFAQMRHCQRQLHSWGAANGVAFDGGKE